MIANATLSLAKEPLTSKVVKLREAKTSCKTYEQTVGMLNTLQSNAQLIAESKKDLSKESGEEKLLKNEQFLNRVGIKDSPTFCCNDYKEFCVLLAVYTKRMMDDEINKMPGNIFIEKSKVRFKKTAEEKALERLRRKRRWEDNERKMKMLESSQ